MTKQENKGSFNETTIVPTEDTDVVKEMAKALSQSGNEKPQVGKDKPEHWDVFKDIDKNTSALQINGVGCVVRSHTGSLTFVPHVKLVEDGDVYKFAYDVNHNK